MAKSQDQPAADVVNDNTGDSGDVIIDDDLLTLVNPWNPLPEDWTTDLVTLSDGRKIDSFWVSVFSCSLVRSCILASTRSTARPS